MANIKSQIKRNRQNEKKRVHNRVYRGQDRTFVGRAKETIENGEKEKATQDTLVAIKSLDKAASKGVIHKNNAARRKSRLMKRLAALGK